MVADQDVSTPHGEDVRACHVTGAAVSWAADTRLLSSWLQVCAHQVSPVGAQGRENSRLGIWEEETGKQVLGLWTAHKPPDRELGILGTPDQPLQSDSSRCY